MSHPRTHPDSTCRLCHTRAPTSQLVQYAFRVYGHPVCLFQKKGEAFLGTLHSSQIRRLPALLLQRAGLATSVSEAIDKLGALERAAQIREAHR